MRPKPSISIGIVAFNEADNIKRMFRSVLDQSEQNYTIDRIYFISDGSTDQTIAEVRSFENPLITIIESKERKGKSIHLNTLFKKSATDIIVLFDADVILENEKTIEHLIQPLILNDKIMYVGGNPQPSKGKTLIERAVNVSFEPYDEIRTHLNNGNNPYGCDGRILALKKEFYKKVTVPEDMIANDNYMYFVCITSGYEFKHVRDARVYFRSPATLADQIRQNKRFIAAHLRMERIFGPIVPESYYIPRRLKYTALAKQLIRHPFLSLLIFGINTYCRYKAHRDEAQMDAKWAIAETTKKDLSVQ